jgi:amino acid transporter
MSSDIPIATATAPGHHHPVPIDEAAEPRLARDKLGVMAIAFFVIAAAAPMAAVVGASPVIFASVGPATPIVYALAAGMIALFAIGYLRMSRYITNAGGFVAYISKGLGTRWASAGAGLAVLCYLTLQIGLWSQYGVFAQSLLKDLASIDLPPVLFIVVTIIVVTGLVTRGVDASLKVLGTLIAGETLVIAVLLTSLVIHHGVGVFSFRGFTTHNLFAPGLGVALLFAMLCYTTFEATVVFSEEARDPRRTIPRALYVVILFVGTFYGLSTWVIGGAIGTDKIQKAAAADPAGVIFNVAETSTGHWLSVAMQILVVTSFIAMLLGMANMFARYLFALGRAGAMPRRLAHVSRFGTPVTAAVVNCVIVGVFLAVALLAGADPIVTLFAWFSALGTAAFMAILFLTSVAVVVFFAKTEHDHSRWVTVIAPVASIVAFGYVGYLTVDNYSLLSGPSSAARWLLVLVPVCLVAGYALGALKPSISYDAQQF